MSEFSCPVVCIDSIEKHPNADTLSITEIEGGPVIFRTADYKAGDLAVYIPVESLIPEGRDWVKEHAAHLTFKNGVHRVKAVRLRKIFSMGMLVPVAALGLGPAQPLEGSDWAEKLGITKYEEPEEVFDVAPRNRGSLLGRFAAFVRRVLRLKSKPKTRLFPIYDLSNFRKAARSAFKDGEEVVVTEKIHGQNFVACYSSKRKKLIVSSHKVIRGAEDNSNWWRVAREQELHELRDYPDLAFYGEIYGADVQDLGYGVPSGKLHVRFFDIYDTKAKDWLSYDDACNVLAAAHLLPVPVLYRGPYDREKVMALRDGNTTVGGVKQIREGVVIRRVRDGFIPEDKEVRPRCVLKLVGDQYLLRANGTEKH